jgi:hypothetical protein
MPSSLVTRDLARRLLDCESVAASTSAQSEPPTFRVYEKLRHRLGAPVGTDGFQALASRALGIARSESPGLNSVRVTADGHLQGLGRLEPQTDTDQVGEDGVILIAQLLDLFLAFLGPALTLQLLRDMSPGLEVTTESEQSTPFENILQEVGHLWSVSERLESLGEEYPAVADALASVSGNIRNIGTILEVLALIRYKSDRLPKNAQEQHLKRYLM